MASLANLSAALGVFRDGQAKQRPEAASMHAGMMAAQSRMMAVLVRLELGAFRDRQAKKRFQAAFMHAEMTAAQSGIMAVLAQLAGSGERVAPALGQIR